MCHVVDCVHTAERHLTLRERDDLRRISSPVFDRPNFPLKIKDVP